LNTTNESSQQPAQVKLALPSWHPDKQLMPLEEEMKVKAAAGELLECGTAPFNLTEMPVWDEGRAVRAAVLRHLLVEDEWPVNAKGVRLRGVRISGHLDLEGAALRCALVLKDCYLDAKEPINLDYATALRLTLTQCQLAGLTGEMLSAQEVDLSGSNLTGPLFLLNANITSQLICRKTRLMGRGEDGNALMAGRMKVGAGVFLDQGFTAAGAVWLRGADITGQLNCRGARLTGADTDGLALIADGMKITGDVFLDQGFATAGAVRLHSTHIAGQLSCRGSVLPADQSVASLTADGLKVGQGVFLDGGFTAAGAVLLPGADITGALNCGGAHLNGRTSDGLALAANGMKVGGNVYLDRGFTSVGTVSLRLTRIGGSVELRPAVLAGEDNTALDMAGAQITGPFVWAPTSQVFGEVNLEGAAVGQLDDDWDDERPNGFWPTGGQLRLNGFTYGRFGARHQPSVKLRLGWIRSQYGDRPTAFTTQPYEHLAAVYRQAGQDGQARKVAIARRADLRGFGGLNFYRKAGNLFLDKTIKYGYQTWRAGAGLAAVFVIFACLSFWAQQHHLIAPVGDIEGLHPVPSPTKCTSSYPCFYPIGYAVDTVIPIINVHQADNWSMDGSAPEGWVFVACAWIATGLGWALATLLVAGYTELVRQE
jgi:uncharacterized protein YjbI with pentapeptide repeats